MVPCTNQQLRISRIKVNLISGHPCLNFSLASGQQSNRLLQGSVTNFFFHKHYGKKKKKEKKDVLEKSVKCSALPVQMVLKLEQNKMLNFHLIKEQSRNTSCRLTLTSAQVREEKHFLYHTQVLQMKNLYEYSLLFYTLCMQLWMSIGWHTSLEKSFEELVFSLFPKQNKAKLFCRTRDFNFWRLLGASVKSV